MNKQSPSKSTWSEVKSALNASSYAGKLIIIALIGLLLLIPLGMVDGLLRERDIRRHDAVSEIENTWGREQVIIGPILRLPYKKTVVKERKSTVDGIMRTVPYTEVDEGFIFLLPNKLVANGNVDPLTRYRGIYETVVYNANLVLSGSFPQPDLTGTGITHDDIQWDRVTANLQVSDLRGASRKMEIHFGEQVFNMTPGVKLDGRGTGVHATLHGVRPWTGDVPFTLDLQVHGSGNLFLAPLGEETDVTLTSPWPDPSFQGAFLPVEQEIGPDGFTAKWQVSYFGRNYPQQYVIDGNREAAPTDSTYGGSLFGLRLAQLMDSYRPVERAMKYGVLIIVLVFGTFFLFELMAGLRVHVLQYVLIGGALILFYLALLSVSEFVDFAYAYAIGAGAATLLITFYSRSILGSLLNCGVIFGLLSAVYLFLYMTLRMQDYALLTGTLGLFCLLAAAMYITRNLHLQSGEPDGPDHPPVPGQPVPPPVPPTAG